MEKEKNSADLFKIKGKLKKVTGTILNPESGGLRFVLNLANLSGKTQDDMYKLFDKKWKKVKEEVRGWYTNKTGAYKFGAMNRTAVQSDVEVVSLLCQDANGKIDLKGLEACLKDLGKLALYEKATVHVSNVTLTSVPELEGMLKEALLDKGVSIYFYDGDKV